MIPITHAASAISTNHTRHRSGLGFEPTTLILDRPFHRQRAQARGSCCVRRTTLLIVLAARRARQNW
jgi:hypothetical protein